MSFVTISSCPMSLFQGRVRPLSKEDDVKETIFCQQLTKFISQSPLNCLNFLFTKSIAFPVAARILPQAVMNKKAQL